MACSEFRQTTPPKLDLSIDRVAIGGGTPGVTDAEALLLAASPVYTPVTIRTGGLPSTRF
jgi:hypothetical protein